MGRCLIFAREVKVDIRRLVAVKSKERFKGDIVTVTVHILIPHLGQFFGGRSKPEPYRAVGYELAVLAVGTDIVWRQEGLPQRYLTWMATNDEPTEPREPT